ncbi:hypothetical protein ACSIGC_06865 [Tenacibaculum sp. ZS6-P6]|uniref:hypothetical protein n=1 Tax=Tenacibaculum sp. ZS6-P6 TaxID=3447503 RepID=UPI003F9E443C
MKIENDYKNDFIESWDLIEQFYRRYPDKEEPFTKDALKLIKKMRRLGLDEELRAGQSLWFLLLSRNRFHGIDKEPHLKIVFLGENKMSVKSSINEIETTHELKVEYDGYLEKVTNELLAQKIIFNEYNYEEDEFDSLFE